VIDDLKPYPVYKDSGVSWLGQVPVHWDVKRQRNIADMRVSNVDKLSIDGEIPVRLCNYVDVYKNDFITDKIPFMRATASTTEIDRFRLRLGDVIVTKDSESWDDIGVPALVRYAAPDLVCGYHLAVLRPRDQVILGDYLFRAIQSQGVASQYFVAANGVTRFGLSQDAIKSVVIPVPPLEEQRKITHYLDYADRRIKRYIRAKQKLIKLLEEQKQAIIHQAVTRGLDPNVRLKPSGVEWVDQIPVDCEIWKIGQFAKIGNGSTPSRGDAGYWTESGYPWLNSSSVNQGRITNSDQFVTIRALRECHLPRVQPNSVLVAITGQGKTRGKAALLMFEATINQHIAFISPETRIVSPDFLQMALVGSYQRLRAMSDASGSTKGAITCADLKHFQILLPSREAQFYFVTEVNARVRDLEIAAAHATREIDLIREYRTRLIADVVTGKRDVREAAAQLPEEVDAVELAKVGREVDDDIADVLDNADAVIESE